MGAASCPHCGGPPMGPPDTHGVRACGHCRRAWLPDGRFVSHKSSSGWGLRIGLLLGGGLLGVGGAVALGAVAMVFFHPDTEAAGVNPAATVEVEDEDASPSPVADGFTPSAGETPSPVGEDDAAGIDPAATETEELVTEPPLEPLLASTAGHPEATFTLHRRIPSQSDLWLLGTVRNDSSVVLDHPEVHLVYEDAEGRVVGAHNGLSMRSHLAPGETSPVRMLVRAPEPHAAETWLVETHEATWSPSYAQDLVVLSQEPEQDDLFGARYAGEVRNDGVLGARNVKVEITAWDAEGRLCGVAETYADTELLEPGAQAPFRTTANQVLGEPVRVEYAVFARPVEAPEEPG